MIELYDGRPVNTSGRAKKETAVYDLLDSLGIKYKRADHEAAYTMEACAEIDRLLAPAVICKNLFLCNSQKNKILPAYDSRRQEVPYKGNIGSDRKPAFVICAGRIYEREP